MVSDSRHSAVGATQTFHVCSVLHEQASGPEMGIVSGTISNASSAHRGSVSHDFSTINCCPKPHATLSLTGEGLPEKETWVNKGRAGEEGKGMHRQRSSS